MSEKKDDVFEEEISPAYTLNEYLQKSDAEDEIMLGDDVGDACTYEKGYMKRQTLFSCLTCTPEGNSGICTACTLSCHEGHEILELGTKRNFRCDCGNSKFGNFFCKLLASKDVENVENSYNHNFKGTYCTCDQQNPDPDVEGEEEMVYCCICEDLFHKEHLGLESSETIPVDEEGQALFEDVICSSCSAACSFLTLYPQEIFVAPKRHDVEGDDEKGKRMEEDPPLACAVSGKADCSHNGSLGTACQLGVDLGIAAPLPNTNKAMFMQIDWRDHLCRCQTCSDFYQKKNIAFLLDKDDSVAEYENQAKQRRAEWLQQQEQNSLNIFNNLGHVQKVEFFSGIEEMKNEIINSLASHDRSKHVTAADVYQMFENLKNKRSRQI